MICLFNAIITMITILIESHRNTDQQFLIEQYLELVAK